jgi:hypothetical protein
MNDSDETLPAENLSFPLEYDDFKEQDAVCEGI